jgi:hypothetical protein
MTPGWGRRDVLGVASAAVAGSVAGCGYRPARGDLRWRTKSRYDETIVVGDAVLGVDWRREERVVEGGDWGQDVEYVAYSAVGQVRTDRDLDLDGVAAGTTVGEDAMYFQTFPDPDPDERDEDDRVTREDAESWSIVRVTPAFDVTDDPPPTPVEDPYELPPAVEHVTHDLGAREPVAVAVGGERVYGALYVEPSAATLVVRCRPLCEPVSLDAIDVTGPT